MGADVAHSLITENAEPHGGGGSHDGAGLRPKHRAGMHIGAHIQKGGKA
jgi:hypothetical protein